MSLLLPALLCTCDYDSQCQLFVHQHHTANNNSSVQCSYSHQHQHTKKIKQFNKQYKGIQLSQLPPSTSRVLHTITYRLSVLTGAINELGIRLDNVEYKLMSSSAS